LEAKREKLALLAVGAVTLLAKGPAAFPGYAIDDYRPSADGPAGLLGGLFELGRVGHWLFLRTSLLLQMEPNEARVLYVPLAVAAYSALGLAVVRFWRVRDLGWLAVGAAMLIANHPYTCEIFTFRWGFPTAAMVMALLSFLLWLAVLPRFHLAAGAVVFALALSFYQIALHFGLMIVLTGFVIALGARLVAVSGQPAADPVPTSASVAPRTVRLLGFILAGTLLYLAIGLLLRKRIGVSADYFQMLALPDLPARALAALREIVGMYVDANVLIPRVINALFMTLVVILVLALGWLIMRSRQRLLATGLGAGIVILLGIALFWTAGVFLILKDLWLTPRSMAHVGVLWAACIVLLARVASSPHLRKVFGAAIAVILVTFVAAHHRMFEDQRQLNFQDLHKAGRIVARLEAFPGFDQIRRVAFVGRPYTYPKGAEETHWKDLNMSAFGAWWAQAPLLREVSGYALQLSTDPTEVAAAAEYCAQAKPWPAAESVAARGELAIVCLAVP
jgi:hypothetical protein